MKYVIGFYDLNALNQFDCVLGCNKDFIFVNEQIQTRDDVMLNPTYMKYDLLLASGYNEYGLIAERFAYDKTTNTVIFNRYDKYTQQMLLKQFIEKYNEPSFHYLKTGYINPTEHTESNIEYDDNKRHFLKPVNGSMSAGILILPKYMKSIVNYINAIISVSGDKLLKKGEEDDKRKNYFDRFVEKMDEWDIEILNKKESKETNFSICEYIIQEENEYTSNTDYKEYRIIANKINGEILICTRNHLFINGVKDEQTYTYSEFKNLAYVNQSEKDQMKIIKEFITHKDFPQTYGSIDVWTSKNKWGIYEYQSQYGTTYLNEVKNKNYILNMIQSIREIINADA